jgi:thiamine-monophosphate kinase
MTEDQHITRWLRLWPKICTLPVGPGDDCAVLPPFPAGHLPVWKTDAVVQDVHFRLRDSGVAVGHKALARVLSDFAAMGALPHSVLVTIGIPPQLPSRFMDDCYRGMARLAKIWNLSLAGGETTRSPHLWISISGLGSVSPEKTLTRSGAKKGNLLFVTGRLGGSFPKRHLTFTPRLQEGLWLANRQLATAMMDLSDGLGKDLPRLASASGVSFRILTSALPKNKGCTPEQAVNDGEDYELLFTVKPTHVATLLKKWPFATRLTCIGLMTALGNPSFHDGLPFQGYDHFHQKSPKSKVQSSV